ncbi:MAG: L-histidine N(alpha)-methyltransferase [Acidobacteria bacterium]|nr:MAG: L-histidine N(alpha)-methyltransferase [Acidobacteriota bacterium]
MLIRGDLTPAVNSFPEDVRQGLGKMGQKELPSKYLYDDVGSALFEVITKLPEYGLTRAEERILRGHSEAIAERLASHGMVVELGSGSGRKTRRILEALARRQPTTYSPIEISPAALESCERELDDLAHVSIVGFETEYLDGLRRAVARRKPGEAVLVLFLGSSIGNFDREAGEDFLRKIRQELEPGDALLLGMDLEKPLAQLISAYDDSLGVTAVFNKNLLARINRELGGNFDLARFEHVALPNARERRIEMHLRSLENQTVSIEGADFRTTFRRDETIWTESCHKYGPREAGEMAERTGFGCVAQYLDDEWAFAENLLLAVGASRAGGNGKAA